MMWSLAFSDPDFLNLQKQLLEQRTKEKQKMTLTQKEPTQEEIEKYIAEKKEFVLEQLQKDINRTNAIHLQNDVIFGRKQLNDLTEDELSLLWNYVYSTKPLGLGQLKWTPK